MWVIALCSFRLQSQSDYVPLLVLGISTRAIAIILLSETITICYSVKARIVNQ